MKLYEITEVKQLCLEGHVINDVFTVEQVVALECKLKA
jgi:hypothetical protein